MNSNFFWKLVPVIAAHSYAHSYAYLHTQARANFFSTLSLNLVESKEERCDIYNSIGDYDVANGTPECVYVKITFATLLQSIRRNNAIRK